MMKTLALMFATLLLIANPLNADDPETLAEPLKVFQPLLGKTFQGDLQNGPDGQPMRDVSYWERALNGQAIRTIHSINDGLYGGETILMWDKKQEKLAFWYFTTDGFFTQGTMEADGNRWIGHEFVTGNDDGITEVKSVLELNADGKLTIRSEYKQNDEWVAGHAIDYVEAPDAKVVFK